MITDFQVLSFLNRCPEALCMWGFHGFEAKECRTVLHDDKPLLLFFCTSCGRPHRKESLAAFGCSFLLEGVSISLGQFLSATMQSAKQLHLITTSGTWTRLKAAPAGGSAALWQMMTTLQTRSCALKTPSRSTLSC